MMLKTLIAGAVLASAIAGSACANVYDFSYTATGGTSGTESGHGQVIISNTETDGHYDILSVNGLAGTGSGASAVLSAITGLSTYAGADNLVFNPGPYVDFGGVSLATKSGVDYNFYFNNGAYYVLSSMADPGGNGANGSQVTDFGVTFISSAIPEASTWALLVAGIGGLGVALRRARSSTGKRVDTGAAA